MFTRSRAIAAALFAGAFSGMPINRDRTISAPRAGRGGTVIRRVQRWFRGGNNQQHKSGVGARECERRRRQIAKGMIQVSPRHCAPVLQEPIRKRAGD